MRLQMEMALKRQSILYSQWALSKFSCRNLFENNFKFLCSFWFNWFLTILYEQIIMFFSLVLGLWRKMFASVKQSKQVFW